MRSYEKASNYQANRVYALSDFNLTLLDGEES